MVQAFVPKFCPACGRTTIHHRRLVPIERIDPGRLPSYPVIDGRAILPLRCTEHEAPRRPREN